MTTLILNKNKPKLSSGNVALNLPPNFSALKARMHATFYSTYNFYLNSSNIFFIIMMMITARPAENMSALWKRQAYIRWFITKALFQHYRPPPYSHFEFYSCTLVSRSSLLNSTPRSTSSLNYCSALPDLHCLTHSHTYRKKHSLNGPNKIAQQSSNVSVCVFMCGGKLLYFIAHARFPFAYTQQGTYRCNAHVPHYYTFLSPHFCASRRWVILDMKII